MPGPVVQGVNGGSAPRPAEPPASPAPEPVKLMPLLAEGIKKHTGRGDTGADVVIGTIVKPLSETIGSYTTIGSEFQLDIQIG